jgi:hypothetical protein
VIICACSQKRQSQKPHNFFFFGKNLPLSTNSSTFNNAQEQIQIIHTYRSEADLTPTSKQWQQDIVLNLEEPQEEMTGVSSTDLMATSLQQDKCVSALTFHMFVNVAWVLIHTYK